MKAGIILAAFFVAASVFSQEPYQVPQTVYVGDRAHLVLPSVAQEDWEISAALASTPSLHIHRIASVKGRLSIDFTAFSTGTIDIPSLDTPEGKLTGLQVHIASISEGGSGILSGPSSPLPVPGTSALLYGIIAGIIVFSFIFVVSTNWRRRSFRLIFKKLFHYYLILKMNRFLKKMQRSTPSDLQDALCLLHTELRLFVSRITGIDCRCLSVTEITEVLGADFASLINRFDTLRFSGLQVTTTDFYALIKDINTPVHKIPARVSMEV